MKKTVAIFVLALSVFSLHAQPTIGGPQVDFFANATANGGTSYTVGAGLTGQTNAQDLPWFLAGTGTIQPTIVSGALSVPGLAPSSGNSVSFNGSGSAWARWNLGNTFSGSTAQTVYYSMAFEITSLGTLNSTGVFVLGFNTSTGGGSAPTTAAARLYARTATGGYNLGINKADGTASDYAWASGTYAVGTVHFIVGAYTFSGVPSSANDSVSLWIDPSPSTFGSATVPTANATTSAGANATVGSSETIESFVLRGNTSTQPTVTISELSIGSSWADVTPAQTQNVYFDPGNTQSGAGSGGPGTWDSASSSDWYNGTAGPDVLWDSFNGVTNIAYFGGAAGGAVSVPGAVSADGLTFAANGYDLSGSGPITLESLPAINVATGTTTIACPLAGGDGYQKTGSGNLTLTDTGNTVSGSVTISGGTLELSSVGSLGSGITAIYMGHGTTLQNDDSTPGDNFISNTVSALPVSIDLMSGDSTPVLNVSSSTGSLTYSSIGASHIGGTGGFTKMGLGTLIIGGNQNTYTGSTVISQGTVQTGGDRTTHTAANLGEYPSAFVVNSIVLNGGTLQGNNPNFAFGPLRGIVLTANSGLSSTINGNSAPPSQGEMGIQGPIIDSNLGFGITITGQTNLTTHVVSGVYLEGTNTYTGATVIQSGILSLTANGSINNSSSISIASGAAFDVSGVTGGAYTLAQPLSASGSGAGTNAPTSAAVLNGPATGSVNFASEPITLNFTPASFTGDTTHPSLYVAQGAATFSGNSISVNNASGTPLGGGTYTLIQVVSGNTAGTPNSSVTVSGSGLAAGATASISVSGGNVNLVVVGATQTPTFSNLNPSPSITYGAASITLTGTVSAPGPVYPNNSETVSATINGHAVNGSVYDGMGDFSITYNDPSLATDGVSGSPYTITYSYGGDSSLNAASDMSTALKVNPLAVVLTGTEPYSGSASAPYSVLTVANAINGDHVTVSGGGPVTLAGSTVSATPWPITGGTASLTFSGSGAANYTGSGGNGSVTITNSFAQFAITSQALDATGTNLDVCFGPTEPGVIYNVLTNTSVSGNGSWVDVGGATSPVTASSAGTCVVIPGATNAQTYVLIKQNTY